VYGVKEINPVEKDNPKINAVPIYGALLDFFKEKQFGNTVKDGNYQKIKNEIYQLTPTRFFDNNFPNIDKNSVVVATNGSAT
jgi:hypothetical protein